jgi:ankyrin repeat protein
MVAALSGHDDTVRMLLDAGADPSPANKVSSCVCMGGVRL